MIQKKMFHLFFLLLFLPWSKLSHSTKNDKTPDIIIHEVSDITKEKGFDSNNYCIVIIDGTSYFAKCLGQNYRGPIFILESAPNQKPSEIVYDPHTSSFYEILENISSLSTDLFHKDTNQKPNTAPEIEFFTPNNFFR